MPAGPWVIPDSGHCLHHTTASRLSHILKKHHENKENEGLFSHQGAIGRNESRAWIAACADSMNFVSSIVWMFMRHCKFLLLQTWHFESLDLMMPQEGVLLAWWRWDEVALCYLVQDGEQCQELDASFHIWHLKSVMMSGFRLHTVHHRGHTKINNCSYTYGQLRVPIFSYAPVFLDCGMRPAQAGQ